MDSNSRARRLFGPALLFALLPLSAAADEREAPPERVRIQHDTVLVMRPRYELRERADAQARFWRRVDQAPLYERLSLDARNLHDGRVDVHILAWGAGDLALPEHGDLLSGDFATAYGRARLLPELSVWGGRRFVTWGLPGGLQVDGVGVEQRSDIGLYIEAIAGRPVTTTYSDLGPHSEYTQPTAAYGARVGFEQPGEISADLAFLERWAHGMAADRSIQTTAAYRPLTGLDLLGSTTIGLRDGIEEARAQVAYLIVDELEPGLTYVHADPRKLLPSWSLFSMFASDVYDEGALSLTSRLSPTVSARAEAGVRRAYLPGGADADTHWGSRLDASVRVRPPLGRSELVLEVGRRDLSDTTLIVSRLGASFFAYRELRIAPELGAAVDEHDRDRTALLARASVELPLGRGWSSALTLDVARTPIALSEVRSLLRVSYRADTGAP